MEPKWLVWAREMQALAQTGLTFTKDPYDRQRYERLRELSAEIFATHSDAPFGQILGLFADQKGYATPKVDVRSAVFDEAGRILLVREAADGGRWTLPGGWADVNVTPAQNAIKEIREETGYDAEVVKVAAVWDRTTQNHPDSVFSCVKMFFLCRKIGGEATSSIETFDATWFTEPEVPPDISVSRILPRHIHRMFDHWRRPDMPTDYD